MRLHQRIALLEAGVDPTWDRPAVPLEMLPSARPAEGMPASGLRQAGQRPSPRGQ